MAVCDNADGCGFEELGVLLSSFSVASNATELAQVLSIVSQCIELL